MVYVPFIMGAVTAFLYGLVIGSFLNVCIYRLPIGESLVTPPSHCPSCNTRLRPRDLFPLFSFLWLRGKCRYCGSRISWRYFTIELITGLLFAAFWTSLVAQQGISTMMTTGGFLLVAMACIFAAAMLVTFMIDLDTTYVIEPVTWIAMGAGLIFEITGKLMHHVVPSFAIGHMTIPYLPAAVPGAIIGFLVFVAMNLFGQLIFRKPSMGLGDAYIGAAIGAMLGPSRAIISFGIAIVLGAVIGILLMIVGALKRSPAPGAVEDAKAKGTAEEDLPQGAYMPFGPFLTASAVLVALAPLWIEHTLGNLWTWWMGLFG